VIFVVSGLERNQFVVTRGATAIPQLGARYGSDDTNQQTTGTVMFDASAGDVIALYNSGSMTSVTLIPNPGGTFTCSNVSMHILRVA
jgi:hypothetical protein